MSGVISRVVEETGDGVQEPVRLGDQLHTHFYEGWLTADLVERSIQDVARFVEKLEALLEAGVE